MNKEKINLNECEEGDYLISSQGAILKYISKTPWENYNYLDHVVQFLRDIDGKSFGKNSYGTRTNDGFAYIKNRLPTDHNIVKIIKAKDFNKEILNYLSKEDLIAVIANLYDSVKDWDGYGFTLSDIEVINKIGRASCWFSTSEDKWDMPNL